MVRFPYGLQTVINAYGNTLIYSTYIGGVDIDISYGISLNNGSVFLTGVTYSTNFPKTTGAFDISFAGGACDGFITKIDLCPTAYKVSYDKPSCFGDTLFLHAGGSGSISWTGPNSFSSGLQDPFILNLDSVNTGVYSILVNDTLGCIDTGNAIVVADAFPLLTASCDSLICAGMTLNLFANGANTYEWYGPDTFSSTLQNPVILFADTIATGTYMVYGMSPLGCTDSAFVNTIVEDCSSIEENKDDFFVEVYPSSTSDFITVTSDNSIKSIMLYDPIGNLVFAVNVNGKQSVLLNLEFLPTSLYIISVITLADLCKPFKIMKY